MPNAVTRVCGLLGVVYIDNLYPLECLFFPDAFCPSTTYTHKSVDTSTCVENVYHEQEETLWLSRIFHGMQYK